MESEQRRREGQLGTLWRPQRLHRLTQSWVLALSAGGQGREGLRAGFFPPELLLFSYNNGIVRTPCRDLDNNRSALSAASAFAIATAGANEGAPNKEKYRRMSLASAGARGACPPLATWRSRAPGLGQCWLSAQSPLPPTSPLCQWVSWVPIVKSVAHGSPVTPPHVLVLCHRLERGPQRALVWTGCQNLPAAPSLLEAGGYGLCPLGCHGAPSHWSEPGLPLKRCVTAAQSPSGQQLRGAAQPTQVWGLP